MMVSCKRTLSFFIIIPTTILASIYRLVGATTATPIQRIVWYNIVGNISYDSLENLAYAYKNSVYIILFVLLYGTYISSYFDSGSCYYFIRVHSRTKWLAQKSLSLACLSFSYSILLIITNILIACKSSSAVMNLDDLYSGIYLSIYIFLVIFLFSYIANEFSLYLSDVFSLLGVIILILISIMFAVAGFGTDFLFLFNPFYMKNTEFIHLIQKIVVLMFENVIVIVIGMILIRKKEIWNVDIE